MKNYEITLDWLTIMLYIDINSADSNWIQNYNPLWP